MIVGISDNDHVIPLAHARRHGADNWTRVQRRTFANDFDNLLVVDNATNLMFERRRDILICASKHRVENTHASA